MAYTEKISIPHFFFTQILIALASLKQYENVKFLNFTSPYVIYYLPEIVSFCSGIKLGYLIAN